MSAPETTPLLPGDASAAPAPELEQAESSPPITAAPADDFPAYFTRRIKILTRFNLIATIISALTLLAGSITIANGPFPYTWNIQEGLRLLGGLIFCAFVLALINTRFPLFPNGLNVIADFFLSVLTLDYAVNLFAAWPQGWCSGGEKTCMGELVAVEVLLGIGTGLGILVGLAHLLMLVLRAVAIFKAGFSSQASRGTSGGLPSGELSFQFSIKFLKQQDTTTGQTNNSTATTASEIA